MSEPVCIPRDLLKEGVRVCTDPDRYGVVLYGANGLVVGRFADIDVAAVVEDLGAKGIPHAICSDQMVQITR